MAIGEWGVRVLGFRCHVLDNLKLKTVVPSLFDYTLNPESLIPNPISFTREVLMSKIIG